MLCSQLGPSHPGRHLHLYRPSIIATQSPPFLQGLSDWQGSEICEQSGPVKPVLKRLRWHPIFRVRDLRGLPADAFRSSDSWKILAYAVRAVHAYALVRTKLAPVSGIALWADASEGTANRFAGGTIEAWLHLANGYLLLAARAHKAWPAFTNSLKVDVTL